MVFVGEKEPFVRNYCSLEFWCFVETKPLLLVGSFAEIGYGFYYSSCRSRIFMH